jgi:hypothetical protein
MTHPLPATKTIVRSPFHAAGQSPLRALQMQPARYYQTTWDLEPNDDTTQSWNGLLIWDRVTETWHASRTNPQNFATSLSIEEEAGDVEFDLIDAAGTVTGTQTIAVEKRTWLMRFREWISIGPTTSLRIDHWYSKVGGWTPKGEYTLLLNASPDQPFPSPIQLHGPYTLAPTRL